MNLPPSDNQLVFTQGQHQIDVYLHGKTLWLTQLQMAQLFAHFCGQRQPSPENLNQRRLQERGIALGEVLSLLSSTLVNQQLVSQQGQDVLRVISDYARTWNLLQHHNEQSLDAPTQAQHA